MALIKNNGAIIDPALCRCCRAIKKCRIMTSEYTWMEKKEVYADMIMDCFGILVSYYILMIVLFIYIIYLFLFVCIDEKVLFYK